jgi:hypothetical protein
MNVKLDIHATPRDASSGQSQEYVDMQLIQSTIEHTPEQFLGTFTKDEIHEWAARLRQAKDDSESG